MNEFTASNTGASHISASTLRFVPVRENVHGEQPDRFKVGMLAFLVSEAAFFSTLLMAYVAYLGKSTSGPTPAEALSLPLVISTTACLLASSATVHRAVARFTDGNLRSFAAWWAATILLGSVFLVGTALEWHDLYWHAGLTPGRNLFGTTYYTLVGFHAMHVTLGVALMVLLLALVSRRAVTTDQRIALELTSWYWHFVDGVWVVVFTVVYLVGR